VNPELPNRSAWDIRLREVAVRLGGHQVLGEVNLDVPGGQLVAIIGPSGAGKTTILKLLNGSVSCTRGTAQVGGQEVGSLRGESLRRLRRGIGFIHQDLRLVPNLRVSQNVLSGKLGAQNLLQSVRMFLRPAGADLNEAHSLLERVGIPEKLFQRTDSLSGGQAQRVAVARALIQKPHLLLADEPVASVDPARAREVLALLVEICRQDGLTLCVSLHTPGLVREFFDRVIGLRDGQVVLDVPAGDLTDDQLAAIYALEGSGGV
jgi:phosphonate transport system ATP-binding protein